MSYVRYPDRFGIQVYANASLFPTITSDGNQAVAADTDIIYVYHLATHSWIPVAAPGDVNGITALTGDVTANGPGAVPATVNSVGGSSASNVNLATILANASTWLDIPSTIIRRDSNGDFAAGLGTFTQVIVDSIVNPITSAPTGPVILIGSGADSPYSPGDIVTYRIYSYVIVNEVITYSTTFFQPDPVTFPVDGQGGVSVSFTADPNAQGYFVIKDVNGGGYLNGFDIANNTIFFDDNGTGSSYSLTPTTTDFDVTLGIFTAGRAYGIYSPTNDAIFNNLMLMNPLSIAYGGTGVNDGTLRYANMGFSLDYYNSLAYAQNGHASINYNTGDLLNPADDSVAMNWPSRLLKYNVAEGGLTSFDYGGGSLNYQDGTSAISLNPGIIYGQGGMGGTYQFSLGIITSSGGSFLNYSNGFLFSGNGGNNVVVKMKADGTQTAHILDFLNNSNVVTAFFDKLANLSIPHLLGKTSAPSIAAGAGAGTSPTVSVTGSDLAGEITVTTGTLPTGTNATIVTLTFTAAYGTAPSVVLTPSNAITAVLSGVTQTFVNSTTTTFLLKSGTTALTASTTYKWMYHVIG